MMELQIENLCVSYTKDDFVMVHFKLPEVMVLNEVCGIAFIFPVGTDEETAKQAVIKRATQYTGSASS